MAQLINCYICGKMIYDSYDPDNDIFRVKAKYIIASKLPEKKKEEFNKIRENYGDCMECLCKACYYEKVDHHSEEGTRSNSVLILSN